MYPLNTAYVTFSLKESRSNHAANMLNISQGVLEPGFPLTQYVDNKSEFHMNAVKIYERIKSRLPISMHIPDNWNPSKEACAPIFNNKWMQPYRFEQFIKEISPSGNKGYTFKSLIVLKANFKHNESKVNEIEANAFIDARNVYSTNNEWTENVESLNHELHHKVVKDQISRLANHPDPLNDLMILESINHIQNAQQPSTASDALANDPHNGIYLNVLAHYIGEYFSDTNQVTCFPRMYWTARLADKESMPSQYLVLEETNQTMRQTWINASKSQWKLHPDQVLADIIQVCFNLAKCQKLFGFCSGDCTIDNLESRTEYVHASDDKEDSMRGPFISMKWEGDCFLVPTYGNVWKFKDLSKSTFVFQGVRYISKLGGNSIKTSDLLYSRDLQLFALSAIDLLTELLPPESSQTKIVLDILENWKSCRFSKDHSKQVMLENELKVHHHGLDVPQNRSNMECLNSIPYMQQIHAASFWVEEEMLQGHVYVHRQNIA